jgi:two-component system phosphate regulon sensor histidine kinase PhoR
MASKIRDMATGGRSESAYTAPDTRTRSIWLTQLVLAASVVMLCVLVLVLQPELFARWNFALGMLSLIVLTLATLAIPWARLPRQAVLAIPFLDALAIGLVASNTELRFGFLWVFPVMWVAMHFRVAYLAVMLALIGAILLVDSTAAPSNQAALRIFTVLLSLTFIGITAHLAMRQTHALRRLLSRQAGRLTVALGRASAQERRTNEILNGVDTGVARLSPSGEVLAVNDAYARLYGLDPLDPSLPARSVEYTELRGMPVPPSARPFARAARGELFVDARVWLFTQAGEWRVLSVTAKPLAASDDEDASILLVVHDVTAITHAQRERERLSAMASHELKHPLTVMIGNAELALETEDLTPKMRQRLEAIVSASERMLEMANSMLHTSRTAFSAREAFDDLDLRQIVVDSVDSFRATANAHEVEIALELDERLPVTADGFRVRQVIDNLVSNAIKYTAREGRVRVVGELDGPMVSLVVSDTGIGIAANDLPNILTPYFRTEKAKETASGTGLGLGITREIIAAHGGTLSIDSEAGVGTTVSVRLPRSARAVATTGTETRA